MLRLTGAQRAFLAEGLRDVASVASGALLFGQFFADRPFSLALAFFGAGTWGALVAFATVLLGRTET